MTGGKRKRSDEGGEDEDEDEDVDVDVSSPTVSVAGRARNRLLEAIYRELFEHIYDYVASPAKASTREVAAISSTKGEKFAKEFRFFTNLVVDTWAQENTGAASAAARAALWHNMYTREEHNRTLREHFFDKPLLVGAADLGVALMCGKISRADTTHETVQNTLRQWQRYNQTAEEIGWKMLAILSFSASFRRHALVADELYWDRVFLDLQSLRVSIELVGDFFCPDWRNLVPFSPVRSMPGYDGHHHLWSVPLDKNALVAQPIQSYEILEKSILGENTLFDTDPMLLKRRVSKLEDPNLEEHCPVCTNEKLECDCPTRVWFPCRIELIQTKTRGVGIRTLQTIHKGQIVGEYIGELATFGNPLYSDDFYLLTGYKKRYQITAKEKGNWTRFANHSCHSNCQIVHRSWRGKVFAMFQAARKIRMFEELTVNYGPRYFKDLQCLCPAKVHVADEGYSG